MATLTQTPWGISANGGETLIDGTPIQTAMQNYVQQAIAKAQMPQQQAKPATPAPAPMTPPAPMQTGWGTQGQQAGGMSLSDILNGPQFGGGGAPAAGTAPPPAMTPPPTAPLPQATMPNPNVPQQNFGQFGKDIMAKILAQGGV